MKRNFEWIGHGGIMLPAVVWLPEQEVKAVLQITHGMTEHMGRYESFAAELCRQRSICIPVPGMIFSMRMPAEQRSRCVLLS